MNQQNNLNFKHSGNLGDVIYALSGIKAVCEKLGVKANLYLWVDRPAFYYENAVHPVYDATGKTNVMLNRYMIDHAIPLLQEQNYIESAQPWQGENIDVDLDRIRQINIGIPYGDIKRWYQYVYPNMTADLSEPCIKVPEVGKKHQIKKYPPYIFVNRTQRYTNVSISYMFLKKYENVIFAGTPTEYALFAQQVPHAVMLNARDFLELAQWIANAKMFIGNQSMNFAIAEQMKTPRVLEVCSYAPNVIPCGKNGYDFYVQSALEYYVDKLWKGETP